IWVPMNDGRIEFFTTAAGNLYSEPRKAHFDGSTHLSIEIDRMLPPADPPKDTEWLKHVSIQSRKLTAFWGRPIQIHATVLLPKGYDDHPATRYPAVYPLGHGVPFSFTPDSTQARNVGKLNPTTGLESGYDFYKAWVSDGFPRVVAI